MSHPNHAVGIRAVRIALFVAPIIAWASVTAAQGPPPGEPYPPPPPGTAGAYPGAYPPGPVEPPPPIGAVVEGYGSSYADTDPSALTDFRADLDPYGAWRNDPSYGTVWVPNPSALGPNFQPYVTGGHWTYDDNDWTWVSDYPWGAVTFHYGRWVFTPNASWAWVPGRQYAGAWVDWRIGNGYVGWAPKPPSWIWHGRSTVAFRPRAPSYFFTRHDDVFAPRIESHVATGRTYVDRTTPYRQGAPPAYGHAAVSGPPPTVLGIPSSHVVRPSPGNEHLQRARQFARPNTNSAPPARRTR